MADVERELGTPLPSDYKELLNRFPGGLFRRIVIRSPVATEQDWTKYKRDLDELLDILGDEDLEYLTDVDYGLFPEPGASRPDHAVSLRDPDEHRRGQLLKWDFTRIPGLFQDRCMRTGTQG